MIRSTFFVVLLLLGMGKGLGNELHDAARGDLAELKSLVGQMNTSQIQANLYECDEKEESQCDTVLHSAAYSREAPVVVYLVNDLKMPVDLHNKLGYTPVQRAFAGTLESLRGCQPRLHATVKALLELGADPNTKMRDCSQDDNCRDRTLLHAEAALANKNMMVPLLVKYGADVHAVDDRGWTPLHYAAECFPSTSRFEDAGCFTMSEPCASSSDKQIDCPSDFKEFDKDGVMFLGYLPTAKYLVARGADVHAKDKDGKVPLEVVASPKTLYMPSPSADPGSPGGSCNQVYAYLEEMT